MRYQKYVMASEQNRGKNGKSQIPPSTDQQLSRFLAGSCGELGQAVDATADDLRESLKRRNRRTQMSHAGAVELMLKIGGLCAKVANIP
jgi:hypothetical protein